MIKNALIFSVLLIVSTISHAETLEEFFNKNKVVNNDVEIRLTIKEKSLSTSLIRGVHRGRTNDLTGRSSMLMRKDGGSYARYAVKALIDACNNIGPYQSNLDDAACGRLEKLSGSIK
jgi:hypothetical protein